MRAVKFIVLLVLFTVWGNATAWDVSATAGIDIYRTRGETETIIANPKQNKTPEYPDWGAACGIPDPNVVCWKSTDYITVNVPSGERLMTLSFGGKPSMSDTTIVYPANTSPLSMNLTLANSSGRWYRYVFYLKNAQLGYSPCQSVIGKKLPGEEAATLVVLVNMTSALSNGVSCQLEVNFASGGTVQVSFAGMSFAYDASVYTRLPPGKHLFTTTFDDSLTIGYYDIERKRWKTFFTPSKGTRVSGYLSLNEYLEFSIISPVNQNIDISPSERGIRYIYVKAALTSNAEFVSTTITCQFTTPDNQCALSDGKILLPLNVGIRADHMNVGSYTAELKPGIPKNLDGDIGFQLHKKSDYMYMFGVDTDNVRAHPETFGKKFTGSISLMLESRIP